MNDKSIMVAVDFGSTSNRALDVAIDLAKRLISVAVAAGCDAVKFQKRTVDVVYSAEELARPRESPFGTTNGDLKHGRG